MSATLGLSESNVGVKIHRIKNHLAERLRRDNRPLYAINEAVLHNQVRRKSRAFTRRIFWRDFREIALGLVAGGVFLVFGGMLILGDEDRWRQWPGPDLEVSRSGRTDYGSGIGTVAVLRVVPARLPQAPGAARAEV